MRIIVRVRELRKNHNLTQEELAKQLNISRQSLISLEQGRWLPSLPLALQLAAFFNAPLEEVIQSHAEAIQGMPTAAILPATAPIATEQPTRRKETPMARDLNPWSPLRDLRDIRDEMDRMMDQSLRYPFGTATVFPTINVKEDEKNYYLEAHVPGYVEEDIDIDITDSMVTVTGNATQEEKSEPQTQEGKETAGYLRREYRHQSFSRTLTLPTPVMNDTAEAQLKNGILTVTLPKLTEDKPKTKRLKPSSK
jgi:HSP20 family protein